MNNTLYQRSDNDGGGEHLDGISQVWTARMLTRVVVASLPRQSANQSYEGGKVVEAR